MLMLNYLTTILLTIFEFLNSVLIPFLSNHILEGITIISIIHLATRAKLKGALDVTAKVVGIAAGGTIIHNNWIRKSAPTAPSEDDNSNNKKDKKENKKIETNQVTNGK